MVVFIVPGVLFVVLVLFLFFTLYRDTMSSTVARLKVTLG